MIEVFCYGGWDAIPIPREHTQKLRSCYLTAMVVFRVVAKREATVLRMLLSIMFESPPQFPPALVSLV